MFSLEIQYQNERHYLFGENISVPVKGCRRKAGKDSGDGFEEQIEVILQGAPGEIDDWLRRMETIFSKITAGIDEAFLSLQTESRVTPYKSKIVSGKIGFLGNGSSDMVRGGMGVCLTLNRENFWTGGLTAAALSNVHGNLEYGGLTVDNRTSAADGKNNFVWIGGETIHGELPAPARIIVKNISNGKTLNTIVAGLDTFYGLAAGENWFEGESGSSGLSTSVVADGTASDGATRTVEWMGKEEVEVVQWVIGSELAGKINGRLVRPVLRFGELADSDDYWVRVAVRQGQALEYSAWQRIYADRKMVLLPGVHIPARGLGLWTTDSAEIAIIARRIEDGDHGLSIDFMALMATDGWRMYSSLGSGGLDGGERLVDALDEGSVYSENVNNGLRKLTHQAVGKGIWLMPNTDQRLDLLFDEAGGECGVDDQVEVIVQYQPRRKNV